MPTDKPKPPRGTRSAGRAVWLDVTARFELTQTELVTLREVVRTVDNLDRLAAVVEHDGPMVGGGERVHPALVETRQLRLVLARLVAALRLPDEDTDERPQRRGSPRGVYAARKLSRLPGA